MATFSISTNDTDMGEYKAETAEQALDKYARDAGYKDYADVVAQVGDDATAHEINVDALCNAVTEKTGFPVFQDSYGNGLGVASVNDKSYTSYAELAESIGLPLRDFV